MAGLSQTRIPQCPGRRGNRSLGRTAGPKREAGTLELERTRETS